jgi:ATP-dependent DNA helicase RecG
VGTVRGEVVSARALRGRRKRFEAVVEDGTGRVECVWFNMPFLERRLTPGVRVRVQGKVGKGSSGSRLRLSQPRWEYLGAGDAEGDGGGVGAGGGATGSGEPGRREGRLRPVYPASEEVSSVEIEKAVGAVLGEALGLIEDHLPEDLREANGLPGLADAYRLVHAGGTEREAALGRRRLAYDELLLLQLGLRMRRAELAWTRRAPALAWSERVDARIRGRLPFELTAGQSRAAMEVARDLGAEVPANRLIQGDVGSGKTAVAVYAMLLAVAGGKQAALLAPTELLAEQHFGVVREMLRGSRVGVTLLTGGVEAARRKERLAGIGRGEFDIVIGTHALLSGDVRFRDLGVVVIDEQHRFGVHQRAALKSGDEAAGRVPHVLVMTATPIPRTLAMTAFGDLDVSVIEGRPGGRGPVETRWVEPGGADAVWADVRSAVGRGERAFVVQPVIGGSGEEDEGSEGGGLRSVESAVAGLREGALRGLRVEALHGRMGREEREGVMKRFRGGGADGIDVLVSTTVIEVGVDVPSATVMVVDHAERFGLAQLHQLRGRVGRGEGGGRCWLIGEAVTEEAASRLRALVETGDGFALAEADLRLRGPGEVVGPRQSGLVGFRVARLPGDEGLLEAACRDAAAWVDRSPGLRGRGDALARSRVLKRYGERLELVDVA